VSDQKMQRTRQNSDSVNKLVKRELHHKSNN